MVRWKVPKKKPQTLQKPRKLQHNSASPTPEAQPCQRIRCCGKHSQITKQLPHAVPEYADAQNTLPVKPAKQNTFRSNKLTQGTHRDMLHCMR